MNNYYIYYHLNIYNLKIYIGITSQKLTSRWSHGEGYKNNKEFYNDIKKYGWDTGFIHGIIFHSLSQQEANNLEQFCIKEYNATNPSFGYNKAAGGYGSNGWHMTKEQKEQLHQRLKEQFNSEEKRKQWGEKHKNHYVSNVTKQKISKSKQGSKNPMAKSVECINTGQIFDTIKEAGNWCGLKTSSHICDVCRNKSRSAGKHPLTKEPLYWRYV